MSDSTSTPSRPTTPGRPGEWSHAPALPIAVSPFFSWPPEPRRMARWGADRWFALAENVILTGLAVLCWAFFQPSPEQTATLELGWVAAIWLHNLVLMLIVAGGLHLYFWRLKRQTAISKCLGINGSARSMMAPRPRISA